MRQRIGRVHSCEHVVKAAKPILLAFSLLYAGNALAQGVEKEPVAIVELGGATDWSITEGGSSFGPTRTESHPESTSNTASEKVNTVNLRCCRKFRE